MAGSDLREKIPHRLSQQLLPNCLGGYWDIQHRLQVLLCRQHRETILDDNKHPVDLVFHGLSSLFLFWHLFWFVLSKYYSYDTKELPNVAAFHKAE